MESSSRFPNIILFLATFLLVGRVQEAFPFLWTFKLTLVSLIFLVTCILANNGLSGNAISKLWQSKTFRMYCLLMGIATIGIPFSVYPGASLTYFIDQILIINGIYILAINAIVIRDSEFSTPIFACALAAFSLSALAIFMPNYRGGRITSIYTYDPNDLALCLVMICGLLFPCIRYQKIRNKILLWSTIAFAGIAIYLTQSRGGLLSLGAAILYYLATKGALKFLKIVSIVGLVIAILFPFVDSSSFGRFSTIFSLQEDYNVSAKAGRIAVWSRGLDMMMENPILGVGIKGFIYAEGALHKGGKWSMAHNSFIEVGAELGIPGLAIFLGMLITAFRYAKPKSDQDWLGLGLRVSLVAYAVGGFFIAWAYHFVLFIVLAIAIIREGLMFRETNIDTL